MSRCSLERRMLGLFRSFRWSAVYKGNLQLVALISRHLNLCRQRLQAQYKPYGSTQDGCSRCSWGQRRNELQETASTTNFLDFSVRENVINWIVFTVEMRGDFNESLRITYTFIFINFKNFQSFYSIATEISTIQRLLSNN